MTQKAFTYHQVKANNSFISEIVCKGKTVVLVSFKMVARSLPMDISESR